MAPFVLLLLGCDPARGDTAAPLPAGSAGVGPSGPAAAAEEQRRGLQTNISLVEELRARFAQGPAAIAPFQPLELPPAPNQASDFDLRLLADAEVTGYDDHLRAVFSGEFWADLNGRAARGGADLFADQQDSSNPWWIVYALSTEWRESGALERLRLGRQTSEHGLPLTFDGAALDLRFANPRFSAFAFGGRTVHFYEVQNGLFEDWVASVGIAARPHETTRLELDARVLHDGLVSLSQSERVFVTNYSYGLTAVTRLRDDLSAKLFARGLDSQVSHVGGALVVQSTPLGLGLDGRVTAQLATLGEVAESENPFYSILGPSQPHVRLKLDAWKEFTLRAPTRLTLHLGAKARRLLEGSESPFNRNMAAVYFQPQLDDVGAKGVYIAGLAEVNHSPAEHANDWFLTLGGSAGYSNKTLRMDAGTYYQRYKVNYYRVAEELLDTRTVYGMVSYRVLAPLELRARYQLEIADRNIHSVFLSMRQDF